MAEPWEQFYSGFSSNYAPSALSTVNPAAQWATNQNQQQVAANQAAAQPQQLLDYNGSYSELRGWNPDANAAGNSGPDLLGGSWGSVMSDAALYPETGRRMPNPMQQIMLDQQQQQAQPSIDGNNMGTTYNPYGGLITGADGNPTYGDLSNSGNFSTYPGGNYDDSFNAPYNPTGGGGLSSDEVAGLYQQFLGRAPDADGLAWAGGLDLNSLTNALTGSQEYQQSHRNPTGGATLEVGDYPSIGAQETGNGPTLNLGFGDTSGAAHVNELYREILGRDADPEGASFWGAMPDDQVRQALLNSQEFTSGYDAPPVTETDWSQYYQQAPDYRLNWMPQASTPDARVDTRTMFDQLPALSQNDLLKLVRTVYGEAANQDETGRNAVLDVLRNRFATHTLDGDRWGSTIEDLVGGKQFSTWNPPTNAKEQAHYRDMMSMRPGNPMFDYYAGLVQNVWTGVTPDVTRGATHYYNPDLANPSWAKNIPPNNDITIGEHRFLGQTPLYPVDVTPPPRPNF